MTDDTDKPPRLAFSVTSTRVQHYSDVVDQLLVTALVKAQREGLRPTAAEVEQFRTDLTRLAVIQRNVEAAINLKFK